MSWCYGIMKHKNEHGDYYELHEIFSHPLASQKGKIGWTKDAISPFGETPEELIKCLKMMLSDAKNCKYIFEYGTGKKIRNGKLLRRKVNEEK